MIWHEGPDRFPEDQLLRLAKFKLVDRPDNAQAIWVHISGSTHTHKDALEWLFTRHDYVKASKTANGEPMWTHTPSNLMYRKFEVMQRIRRKIREEEREAKQEAVSAR